MPAPAITQTWSLFAGCNMNTLNFNQESPLSAAIQFARIDYMLLLMKLKAQVDDHGSTPIHVAARHGLKEAVTFLVRLGTTALCVCRHICCHTHTFICRC
jgi:ankyrin repeat protein